MPVELNEFMPLNQLNINMQSETEKRKADHIRLCTHDERVDVKDSGWEDITLIHQAMPEIDFQKIDTSASFLGKKISLPLMIDGMTGGTPEAKEINRGLAEAAEKFDLVIGVGSQRAMIEKPELLETYYIRDLAPKSIILGNIGISHVKKYSPQKIEKALKDIDADAVAVHVNPGQEIFQAGGDIEFGLAARALKNLCESISYPVIGKEVGNGVSRESALLLKECGVKAIDVGGFGGTNFLIVDAIRTGLDYSAFSGWGIKTPISILESNVGLPIIATGGVRTGLDIAKSIALGADIGGMASPFLKAFQSGGVEPVEGLINKISHELKVSMFLAGAENIEQLKKIKYILGGKTLEWKIQRGL